MKTSGTKPMKNTMRKSPINQTTKAAAKAASIAKDKKATPAPEGKPNAATIKTKKTTMQPGKPNAATVKTTKTTKAPEGKPSSRPGSSKPKGAFAGAASKAAGIAAKATPMQMKKKC